MATLAAAVDFSLAFSGPVEDKYILNNIKLNDKKGFFLAVFDGHGGDIISEYAKENVFSLENFGNLLSDVALQWGQQ